MGRDALLGNRRARDGLLRDAVLPGGGGLGGHCFCG